jgi:DNA-binding transcriptional ArsR family regulator
MDQQPVRGLSGFGAVPVADALEALADERRRAVVRVLDGTEGPVPLQELATEIRRRPDGAQDRDRERIVVDLHHRTLPKLDTLGIVDYDSENNVVEPRSALGDLLGPVEHVEYTSP